MSSGGVGSVEEGTGGLGSIDEGTGGEGTGGEGDEGTGGGAGSGGEGSGGTDGNGSVRHLFLLMGQSNMAGVAPKEPGDQNTDERLLVWGGCNQPEGQWNIANPPLNDCPGEKGWNLSTAVGPGMWFAKTIAASIPAGDTIGLIGTAESGESIDTFIEGGVHHEMILRKIDEVKDQPDVRFAGILFHQGESDTGSAAWPGKVLQLYGEVKVAFGVNYDVPMILGELPTAGCCASHNPRVHEAAEGLPMGSWISQDGTSVMDQYHFDHASVVLMGERYAEAMIDALDW